MPRTRNSIGAILMFAFDSEKHEYRLDDVVLPSITQILKECGFLSSYTPQNLNWYLERGKLTHQALEMYQRNDLDIESLHPEIAGCVKSGMLWIDKYGPSAVAEKPLYDPIYLFAGTPDRHDGDFKRGVSEKWHILQIAAQRILLKANKIDCQQLDKTIILQPDGTFPKTKNYKLLDIVQAERTFLCCVNIYKTKQEMKLI